nr:MAG TPA: hypothetical protein [Caudoviricetes sp.]
MCGTPYARRAPECFSLGKLCRLTVLCLRDRIRMLRILNF